MGDSRASSSRHTERLVLNTPRSEQNTTHSKTYERQRAPEERKRKPGGTILCTARTDPEQLTQSSQPPSGAARSEPVASDGVRARGMHPLPPRRDPIAAPSA